MRLAAVFFLLLLSAAFSAGALYGDPPLASVTEHNLGIAPGLNDSFSQAAAVNGSIGMDFNGTDIDWVPISEHFDFNIIGASARLVSMEPSLDNATWASGSPRLVFAWGALAGPLAQGDYEHDDCNESQVSSSISRSASVTFSFANASETVAADSNVVPVPEAIMRAMQNTTGAGVLQVRLNATFDFTYEIDDRMPSHDTGCLDHPVNFTASLLVADGMNWTVEGNRTLFFLRSPILGEQWFRDNRFDTLLFSSSRIYEGEITGPGNQSYAFRLYAFNITNDSYGAWHAVSVPLESGHDGVAGHSAINTPTALSHDNFTYAYLYEFNYSYEGLGENTLTVRALSPFGENYSFRQELLSRMLTYAGNTTELGGAAEPSDSRPSFASGTDSIRTVALSLGLVGVLFVLLLINRIRYK
jgi:hypothetical protein